MGGLETYLPLSCPSSACYGPVIRAIVLGGVFYCAVVGRRW